MQLSARMQTGPAKKTLPGQKKHWHICPTDPQAPTLAKETGISLLTAQVLINRGIGGPDEARAFLAPKLTQLIPPEKMPGTVAAVTRIKTAIGEKQKITVYGDYDVDGITGVAILEAILAHLGADVDFYIPHRVDEGYGLNAEAIESIAESGTTLLVTVDCGITAVNSAMLAEKLGMDLIITDHHRPADKLPEACAIVHPAIDSTYENPNSAGAMVAFKLAWALANEFNSGAKLSPELRDFMINATSLAAMGTVADVMDLKGENRVLTNYGLKTLPDCKLPGMQALIEIAGLTGEGLDSFHVGFRLAPMINAAGRMGHARLAVELLTCQSTNRSMQIAEYLKNQNAARQKCEKNILKQACDMVVKKGLNHPDRKSIVLADDSWHTGVIGIVASRIVDKFYRPTILLNSANGIAQGSARSIDGFDLLAAISACSDHLVSFGGHKKAAGLKLENKKIQPFADALEEYAKQNLTHDDCQAKLNIDAEASLEKFTHRAVSELQMLAPFGQGNPRPVFATKGVKLASPPRRVGAKSSHLQIAITDNTNAIRCIGFGMGIMEKKLLEHQFFNIAYEPQINTYNGQSNVQLVITDIQFE
jgi:single-stranded-DNA-specific exonuclease